MDEATLEKIKRQKIKTPLQKAIQILKRHRDVMYESLEVEKMKSQFLSSLRQLLRHCIIKKAVYMNPYIIY